MSPYPEEDLAGRVYMGGWLQGTPSPQQLAKRDFSAAQRDAAASKGHALPDGSFPIENTSDLHNAISAVGRAKDVGAAKAHIIRRARALGTTELLPKGWG